MSLNTHYCNLENPFAYYNESSDIGEQWHWAYTTLEAARAAGEKVSNFTVVYLHLSL